MGPPSGRPPIADELRPQSSPIRQTRKRVPVQSPPADEHISHVSTNNHNSQDSTTFSRSQPDQRYQQPDQRYQQPDQRYHQPDQRYHHQQHQPTFVNNQYPNTQSVSNSDPQFQPENPQIRDPPPQDHIQVQETNMTGAQSPTDEERDVTDYPSRYSHRTNVRVNVSTEKEVCESTPDILTSFIIDRMEYDGHNVPPGLSTRNRKNESDIAVVLRRMGDDISSNCQLNHFISEIQVTPHTAYKTFASVACQIFTDGNINWGRVVMLFYFAYKLALQVLNQLPLIDIIIGWVTKFVAEKLATWISARGGWAAIREYYGSTTGQMVGVFLAGILVSTLFWYWRR